MFLSVGKKKKNNYFIPSDITTFTLLRNWWIKSRAGNTVDLAIYLRDDVTDHSILDFRGNLEIFYNGVQTLCSPEWEMDDSHRILHPEEIVPAARAASCLPVYICIFKISFE